jgi:signal transduction histidine kinase/tetratricopeptide (TPR) repeat protein
MKYLKIGAIVLIFSMIFSPSAAQRLQIDSLKKLVSLHKDSSQVFIFNELSWYYKNIDVDSSELYARQAIALAKSMDDQALLAESFNRLGNAKQAAGKYDSALIFLNESITIFTAMGDSLKTGVTLNNIGINYDEQGDYVLSLKAYFKALRIADATADSMLKADILSNIGVVYKKQKQYDKVLEYYQSALELYKKINSPFGETVIAGNIGSVLLQTGDYKKSITYSLLAKKGYEALGYSRYIPYTLGNMALAYDSLHQREKAEQFYLDAYEQHSRFANKYEMAYVCKNLAFFYLLNNQSVNALTYARKAIELAKIVGAKEMLRDSYYAMARVNHKLNLHEQAYLFQQKYISLNDSLIEQGRIKTIFELQTKYETEKKEKQIALQNSQLSENKIQLQRTYLVIAALVIVVTLIIVIFALMRSRLKRKQQLIESEKQLAVREAFIDATLQSQEGERKRVAQDLHDGMGQLITELRFMIGNIKPSSTVEERVQFAETGERVLNDMHKEVRAVAFNLMPQTLIQSGVVPTLREMALRIGERNPVKVEVTSFELDRLSEVQEISIYRICQEWINNVLKYSGASKVDINLVHNGDDISITIEDDGEGFDSSTLEHAKGNGWKNILSRAGLIKASVDIDSTPGRRGTSLLVSIPVTSKKATVENTR